MINSTLLTSWRCLDVMARALAREHGYLLSDWLSVADQTWAQNALAECVNLTEIMDLMQEIRDLSYGTSYGDKIKYPYEQCAK